MKNISSVYSRSARLSLMVAVFLAVLTLLPIRAHAAPLLRRGSTGEDVVALQMSLSNLGFDPGPVDGVFGPRTEKAVKDFQRASGLVADGISGPLTYAALKRLGQEPSRGTGSLRGRVIVLDPGHGGPEPGAISYWGDKEKDFTLPMAIKAKIYLESQGATVVLTRAGDYTPGTGWTRPVDDLLARVSIANSRGADMFVSIHCNAYPKDPSVSGVMGFYRAGSSASRNLALAIARRTSESTGLSNIDTQVGPYYVLSQTYMPAALIEVGFMTNWSDTNLLRQNWFQDSAAKGIAKGIMDYLGR
ncbi:MAG: N-acetylmuramoyl-L-alanine amidase [Bacillota bacterium]|jgi:N-acetylmuramoyl-L-alanine amidase